MSNRKRESIVRLETLGGLSEYYSDVARPGGRLSGIEGPINIDDQTQWEIDSVSSTTAEVFVKPPAPGLPGWSQNSRRAREVARPSTSYGSTTSFSARDNRGEPKSSIAPRELHRSDAEQDIGENFHEAQPRSAKSLSRSQYSRFTGSRLDRSARPASAFISSQATSDYSDEPLNRQPKYRSWQPRQPLYVQVSDDSHSSRPVSGYAAYDPSSNQPPTPGHGSTQQPFDIYSAPTRGDGHRDSDELRSKRSSAPYSFAPPTVDPRSDVESECVNSPSESNNRRRSYIRGPAGAVSAPPHRPQRDDLANSFGPEVAAPPARGRRRPVSPPPSPAPSPSPSPSPCRERRPFCGAWRGEHPRQKRPSFVDRTRERVRQSAHMHLVKAGRRPLPSFELHSMSKSPVEDVASWQAKSPTLSPPAPGRPLSVQWQKRLEREATKASSPPVASAAVAPSASPAPAPPQQSVHRNFSLPHRPLRQKDSELFGIPYQPRASGIFDPAWTSSSPAHPQRRNSPGLWINTQVEVAELPAAVPVAELEAPSYPPPPPPPPAEVDGFSDGRPPIAELGAHGNDDRRDLPSQLRASHYQQQQQQGSSRMLSRKGANRHLR